MTPKEKRLLSAALVVLGGAILAQKTFQYRESFRQPLLELLKQGIGYEGQVENGSLSNFDIRIPGRWKIADVIAEVLANPNSSWVDVRQFVPPSRRDPLSVEVRHSGIEGLYLLRTYDYPSRKSSVSEVTEAIPRIRLVGENRLPIYSRFISYLNVSFNKEP